MAEEKKEFVPHVHEDGTVHSHPHDHDHPHSHDHDHAHGHTHGGHTHTHGPSSTGSAGPSGTSRR